MKFLFLTISLRFLYMVSSLDASRNYNLVCFLDAVYHKKYDFYDLENGIKYCTHVVYNFVSIEAESFKVIDVERNSSFMFTDVGSVTDFKTQFPHIKFLLSIGSELDQNNSENYIQLLEAGREKQQTFIQSAKSLLNKYNFDGLDLSFPLPRNKPHEVHTELGLFWKSIKEFFAGESVVDNKAAEHRQQITNLIKDVRTALKPDDLMLTLTVLPNVNSSWYYDAPAIMDHLDFVNLAAFDFVTPNRNPEEADYASPLYESPGHNRYPYNNVNFQVEHWLKQSIPANKINLGISTYGLEWIMTAESGSSGVPVVTKTNGSAPYESGKIHYQFLCLRINARKYNMYAEYLQPIADPTNRSGAYAFRPVNEYADFGEWVSYESRETAAIKTEYAKQRNLGGIAVFDLTNDDLIGRCEEVCPILHSVANKLFEYNAMFSLGCLTQFL